LRRLAISSELTSEAINHAERYFKALKESLTDVGPGSGSSAGPGRHWWLKMDRELRVIEHLFAERNALVSINSSFYPSSATTHLETHSWIRASSRRILYRSFIVSITFFLVWIRGRWYVVTLSLLFPCRSRSSKSPCSQSSHSHDHEKNSSQASLAKFRPIARTRAE